MIRVLQELSALDGGGVAKLLYDYYRHMDHEIIHFDFLIYDYYEEGMFEQPLRNMGCTIYRLPRIKKDRKTYIKRVKDIIKNGNYDAVHSHMGSRGIFIMYYANKYGVKKRIAHSHIANEPVTFMKGKFNSLLALATKHFATDLFACGRDAGIYMWGRRAYEKGQITIMKNAVETSKFMFSDEMREQKRAEIGVSGKLVLGIVGRLSEQKNYPFLFRVYKRLNTIREDSVLVIVGRGLEEEKIKKLAKDMGLAEKIVFLGVRSDVSELMNAFDVFVLPSLYEGLPVVLIEAQANGLPAIVSDFVTDEIDITGLIKFLPVNETEHDWVDEILNYSHDTIRRSEYSILVAQNGYDIREESMKLQNFY